MSPLNPTPYRHHPRRALLAFLLLTLVLSGCSLRDHGSPAATAAATRQPVPDTTSPAAGAAIATPVAPSASPVVGEASSQIVQGGTGEPRTLNPILVGDPLSDELSHLVFDGLVTVDPASGKAVGDLAASWDVSDDGTVYTFHLRDGVSWSDGRPFSAADVVFTYQLMMNEKVRSPRYSRLVERVRGVQARDAATVTVTLIRPDASFLTNLATLGIVPEHVLGSVLPEQLVTDPFGLASTVGTGPFTLRSWSHGEQLVFARNPAALHAPAVEQYVYRVVADPAQLLAGLHDGSIDWGPIAPDLVDQAKHDAAVKVVDLPGYELETVTLQLDSAKNNLFLDPNLRKALMLALDRGQLVSQVWHGEAKVADGIIPPASWAAAPSATSYAQNLDQARKLLQDAGWVTGDDGIRNKNGTRLRFRLATDGDNPQRQQAVNWLMASWRAIGVDVVPDFEKASSLRLIVTQSRDFDALLIGLDSDLDPDPTQFWASGAYVNGLNVGRYTNPEVDQLLADALATTDAQKRADDYHKAQDDVMNDLPVIPLVFPNQTIGLSQRLAGVSVTAITSRNLAGVDAWAPAKKGS